MKHFWFNMSSPVCDELFVDRDKELRQTMNWIASATGNLIISGERGIGKTSLAWKAVAETQDKAPNTLVIRETVYPFHGEGFDSFLSELAKQITATIWRRVTGNSFSELFSAALDSEERKIEPKGVRALRRIYNLLSASQFMATTSKMSKIGGKLLIDASSQEELEKGISRTSITSFEFMAIVDELKEVASRHGYSRIVVIADEFNYLRQSEQSEFIQRYFQILNARSIVFGLIGIDIDPWSMPGLRQCVETYIPLGPFDSVEHVHSLITAGLRGFDDRQIVDFLNSTEICAQIFGECKGNPRLIQAFCFSFLEDLELSRNPKNLRDVFERTRRMIIEQHFREQELLKQMRG